MSAPAVAGPDGAAAGRVVAGLLAACGVLAVGLALADVRTGVLHEARAVVTATFLLLGTGWAVAGFVRGASLAMRFVLAAGAGAAVSILGGQAMVVAGLWHPVAALLVAAVLAVPALIGHATWPR